MSTSIHDHPARRSVHAVCSPHRLLAFLQTTVFTVVRSHEPTPIMTSLCPGSAPRCPQPFYANDQLLRPALHCFTCARSLVSRTAAFAETPQTTKRIDASLTVASTAWSLCTLYRQAQRACPYNVHTTRRQFLLNLPKRCNQTESLDEAKRQHGKDSPCLGPDLILVPL